MTEAGSGVGWRRRDRTSDVAAAALITLGGLVGGSDGVAGRRMVGVLLTAAGVALALLHRDRWIERTNGEVWLGTAWWWFRPWRTRRVRLQPDRVVIEPEGTGWWARRRTVLSIANDVEAPAPPGRPPARAVEILERWTEPSSQEFAQSVAASLARWLGVPTGGVLAPFEAVSPEAARSQLRRSLTAPAEISRSRPRRARWQVTGRTHLIAVPRRWFEVLGWAWVVLLGGALTLLRRWNPSDRLASIVFSAALPVGAALVLEGLRGVLPGRLVTRVGPDALNVERAGLSRELRVQVLFSDMVHLGVDMSKGWRRRRVLKLVLRDQVVEVNAAELGLAPRDLPWFAGVCRDAMGVWLDRFPVPLPETTASNGEAEGQKLGTTRASYRPDRYRPSSVLSVLGSMFPWPAHLAGALLVVGLQPLERALSRELFMVPGTQMIEGFGALGSDWFTGGFYATSLAAGLAGVTLAAAGFKLMWSAPRFPGSLAFPILSALVAPLLVANMVAAAPHALDVAVICGGSTVPTRYPLEVSADHQSFRYGRITVRAIRRSSKLGDLSLYQFDRVVLHAGPLLEVRGLLGATFLVVADDFERTCGAWNQRIGRTRP